PLHRLHILTASFRALDLDLIVDLFLQLHLLLFDYTSTTHFYTLSLHDALPIFEIFFLKKLSGFIWMRLIRFIKMNIWNIKFRCNFIFHMFILINHEQYTKLKEESQELKAEMEVAASMQQTLLTHDIPSISGLDIDRKST